MGKYPILFLSLLFTSSTYAQNMGVKMTAGELPNTTLDVNGSFAFREASPLSLANGDNHNFALDAMSFYRVNAPTAAFSISGFTGGEDGRILRIANTTTQVMTLKHQNTNSTAANRLLLPNGSDLGIGANGSVTLQYSTGLNRWLVVGFTGASLNAWGLTGNSNTNPSSNFIGTTDNVGLGLRTNNTEIVRITEGGNVGIGTTAPTSKLHIVGGDNTPVVNTATTNVLSRLTNSAGGSVVQNLETITSTGTRGIRMGINPTAPTCSTPGVITFQAHSTVAGDNSVSDIIEYSFTDRNLILLPWTTNATKNVGIGTNVPDRKLSVVQTGDGNPFISSASANLMRFESTANGSAVGHFFKAKDATGATKETVMGINPNSYGNNGAFVITDAAGQDFLGYNLTTKNGWTNANATSGGNFGVGTQFPTNKLEVYKASTTTFDGVLTITANPSAAGNNGWNNQTPDLAKASAGIQFKGWNNLNEGGIFRQTGSLNTSHMLFTVNSTNEVAMTITEGLRLGIGTTTPSQKLHVIGNILASGTITPSDARFKENIITLTGALTKIKQLRGVSYIHKTAFIKDHGLQQGNQIGFIAQELEQVFPEFVVTSADGYKAVDYARLTPVLVESLKEVNAKLEAQQAEINELKAAVKQLMDKR